MAEIEKNAKWFQPIDPSVREASAREQNAREALGAPTENALAPGTPILSEDQLRVVVHVFYERVRRDPKIGPVFDSVVEDWPEHLDKLTAFWSSVTLGSGRYKGNPMAAHRPHAPRISAESFERWLALWTEVTNDLLPAADASELQMRATRMAINLQRGLAIDDTVTRARTVFR